MGRPPPLAASAIDAEQIEGLLAAAGIDGVRVILEAFGRSTESLLSNLRKELAVGDLAAAARAAHALKGSSLNVGATLLAEAARAIEMSCKSTDAAGAQQALTRADSAFAETSAAFTARIAEAA